MKEKELRLALVFYGGVSLAIYQHGVNREILNLIRASRAYHLPRIITAKQDRSHVYRPSKSSPGTPSTEPVYFNLLKTLGASMDLRVIVDIISGSSAGGINGVSLGRAIAHDLDISPLTEMWLEQADILRLLAPEARARFWSKWYLWPFVRLLYLGMAREGFLPPEKNLELRKRISTFIRSRWFKPPLDGSHFLELLLTGFEAMTDGEDPRSTLLPPECTLDLFLSVTDYHGIQRPIFIHDPPVIHENEHKRLIHFSARRSVEGISSSDLGVADIPALAFASRATASYPGAFPPAQITEIDRILSKTGRSWPGRAKFIDANFSADQKAGIDPSELIFLDGSVLNNRPVRAAIHAISRHYAYREVDRRLVYVDPHPSEYLAARARQIPGFFSTIRSALSDLPRMIPIYEELENVGQFNTQVERLEEIVNVSRTHVISLIEQATQGAISDCLTAKELRHLRLTSTNLLAKIPLVYDPWVRALVNEGIDIIADIIADLCNHGKFSQEAVWIEDVIEAWCRNHSILKDNYLIPDDVMDDAGLPDFSQFIVNFAIPYKKRRISLIISSINSLYRKIEEKDFCNTSSDDLDILKKKLNKCLENIDFQSNIYRNDIDLSRRSQELFCCDLSKVSNEPAAFARAHGDEIAAILERIRKSFSLMDLNEEMDEILTSSEVNRMGVRCRQEIRAGYVGFPYWDIVLLPNMSVMNQFSPGTYSFARILVDRISPIDGHSFSEPSRSSQLLGASVIGFGGFMSRKARENDYLWGRLNGVERLVDIIESAITDPDIREGIDFAAFKREAFRIVLDQEADQLTSIPETLENIRARL